MKNSSTCPKCQSTDVIRIEGSKVNQNHKLSLDKWGVKNVVIDRYLCVQCGYTEEWIQLDEKFDRWVEKQWSKNRGDYSDFV